MRFSPGSTSRSRPNLLLTLSVLFVVGAGLRLLFVNGTLRANTTAKVWAINGDSYSYRHLGHNIRAYGRYTRDEEGSHYTAILRPPVYPLVLAAFEWLKRLPDGVLWSQAIVGALIPPVVAWLAWVIYQERWAMWLAGVLAAFSPTGIFITAAVLPDLLLAALFVAAFGAMLIAVRENSGTTGGWVATVASGLLFGVAALTKPALTFWPVALVAVWWLLARAFGGRAKWGRLAVSFALQLSMILAWCARNYAAEGIFTFSAIPAQNLRNMIVPRMEVWLKLGDKPNLGQIGRHYINTGLRTKEFLHDPNNTIAQLIDEQMSVGLSTVRAHPWMAFRVYLTDVLEQIPARWDVYDRQLRDVVNGGTFDPWERSLFDVIFSAGESLAQPPRWFGFELAVAALILPWLSPRERRNAIWRRRVWVNWALALTYVYFLALAGTTFAQGTRVMYPAQFTGTLLVVSAFVSSLRFVKRAPDSERDGVGEQKRSTPATKE